MVSRGCNLTLVLINIHRWPCVIVYELYFVEAMKVIDKDENSCVYTAGKSPKIFCQVVPRSVQCQQFLLL